jgi:hypothetical protein
MTININRRDALAGAGALVVSMTLPGVKARAGTLAARLPLKPEQLATYISINQDGSAVGWIGKVDMGQGTDIGWTIMVAEELDLPADRAKALEDLFKRKPGKTSVRLRLEAPKDFSMLLDVDVKVRPDKEFRAQVEQICGPECLERAAG